METALPNLHPAVIHLPLALVPLAVVLDLFALVKRDHPFFDRLAAATWVIGAVGTLAAWLAGREAADSVGLLPAEVSEAVHGHADAAQLALIAIGVVALGRAAASWKAPGVVWPRAALLVGGMGATVLLMLAADQGGALVYQHGVAVDRPAAEVQECPACETFAAGEVPAGSWIEAEGERVLLVGEAFSDVQVSATVELHDFAGRIGVVHHWADTPGAFVIDTRDGSAVLSATSGELHTGSAEPGRTVELATSALGTHYKGYVDGEVITHGHTDAEAPGRPGLWLDGTGRIRLVSLEVEGESPAPADDGHGGHAH